MALPKKINQDVQLRKSLWRFGVSLALTLFLAIIFNAFLSQIPLQSYLEAQLKESPDFTLELMEPQLQFKKGWLPIIGLSVARLEAEDKACLGRKLVAQEILAPIRLSSLLMGKIRWAELEVSYLDIYLDDNCAQPQATTQTKSDMVAPTIHNKPKEPLAVAQGQLERASVFLQQKLAQRAPSKSIALAGIHIQSFKLLHSARNQQIQVSAQGSVRVRMAKDPDIHIQLTQLKLNDHVWEIKGTRLSLQASGNSFEMKGRAKLREGVLSFSLNVPLTKQEPVQLKFKSKNIPLSYLSSFYLKENSIAYLWLDCEAELSSPLQEFLKQNLDVGDCSLNGPYGSIRVSQLEASLSKIQTIEVEADKLDIDKLIKNRREAYLSGVFSRYGILSQRLIYQQGEWTSQGYIERSDVVFSRKNRREVQRVNKLSFELKGDGSQWTGELIDLDLEEGEVQGRLAIIQPKDSNQIQGQLSVHRLRVAPKIYNLLFKSQSLSLSVYGKFLIEDKKLTEWSALAATPIVQAEDYRLENLKVRAENSGQGQTQISINVRTGSVSMESELASWLRPTTLEMQWPDQSQDFKELSLRLLLSPNQSLRWERAYVALANGWQLSSEGEQAPAEGTLSWLQWDRPDGRVLRWDFRGPLLTGQWYPQTGWVRDWLATNQSYLKKNKQISFEKVEEGS
jgi:hypothetical protein